MRKKRHSEIDEEKAISLLSVIADPAKLRIARLLAGHKEMRSGDIAMNFDTSRTTISHHLATMRMKGFVRSRKQGKEVFYSLNKEHVLEMLRSIVCYIEHEDAK